MSLSLEQLCIDHIANTNYTNLNESLNSVCYDKILEYQTNKGFEKWQEAMNSVKIELNIKNIEVNYDMYFDEPTYFIFVKKKVNDNEEDEADEDEEYEDEYEVYRDMSDNNNYDIYYNIAKKRGLIE